MDYTCRVEQRQGYLHVKVSGDNSRETVARYLGEVRAACLRHGCSRVLIEENLHGPSLSTATIYAVVMEGSRTAGPGFMKIAFVDVNRDHKQELMHFAETVAVNRGLDVCVFKEVRDAERWLERDDGQNQQPEQPSGKPA